MLLISLTIFERSSILFKIFEDFCKIFKELWRSLKILKDPLRYWQELWRSWEEFGRSLKILRWQSWPGSLRILIENFATSTRTLARIVLSLLRSCNDPKDLCPNCSVLIITGTTQPNVGGLWGPRDVLTKDMFTIWTWKKVTTCRHIVYLCNTLFLQNFPEVVTLNSFHIITKTERKP